ncbi:MAG: lytic murein transglycosylase [Solirubrobacterales bacterium]
MSAPRRWGRRAALALAGSGLTAAGLGGTLPGGALGAEAPAGPTGTTETPSPPITTTGPQAPAQGGGETPESSTTTSTAPAASAPSTAPSSTSTTPSAPAEAPAAGAPSAGPTVVVQRRQQVTPGRRSGASVTNAGSGGEGAGGPGSGGSKPTEGAQKNGPSAVPPGTPNGVAPAPLAAGGELNPTLPQAMLFANSAVSAQALDFYRIPLFLLPIYQAAAYQYDVPWQILAAINEVETNYGTDQSVSTAGAVGWMQFMPATWQQYGVDATNASYADPYNPVDAIFAAARYLHAAGASQNLHAAILAYNHSQEYVESVLLRARLIASYPRSVIGTLTGLVDGRPPTPGARVGAVGGSAAGGLGAALPGGGSAGSAPGGIGAAAPASASGASPGAGGSSSATAGAVPLGVAPTPADAAANAAPGSTAAGSAAHGTAGSVAAGSAAHGTAGGAADSAAAGRKPTAAGASTHPGLTPPPPPRVAARRAEAAANAPAKVSQLVELLGTPGAPVVAVENGRIVHLGRSHALGRYLVLRDIYGDVFTYAGLGSIAPRYRPSLPSPERTTRPTGASAGSAALAGAGASQTHASQPGTSQPASAQGGSIQAGPGQAGPGQAGAGGEPPRDPAPTLPATAGHQPPVTLKVSSHVARALAPVSGRAGIPTESEGETAPPGMGRVRLFAHPGNPIARTAAARAARSAGVGNGNWLALRTGSIVSEGTVLGHLHTPVGASAGKLRFAVRPGGDNGTIDPRPLLANWKQLGTALHPRGSRGANPLLGATAGEALLMSKGELQRAVLADAAIQLDACGRRDVAAGALDRRVLAVLEFLSRGGLQPTVGGLVCPRGANTAFGPNTASGANTASVPNAALGVGASARTAAQADGTAADISAINGVPIAGHQGRGTIADAVIRTLLTLRGRFAPQRIVSLMKYPEAPTTQALPSGWDHIHIDFPPPPRSAPAHAAAASATAASPLAVTGDLSEAQWSQLIERIAALPKPTVAAAPSKAAISDPQAAPTNRELGTSH